MTQIETGSFACSEGMESRSAFRVISWNIARGSKLEGILEFLATANADIIFLQEADKSARRTGYRNIAKEIAQKLRLNYVFGCEFEELAQGSTSSPAYHGQATLSRWPLSNSSILPFHKQSTFWRPRWFIPRLPSLQRRRGGRMALFSQVLTPDRSVEDLKRCSPDVPVIAAGDFNFDLSQGQPAAALADVRFVNPFATLRQATTVTHSLSARDRVIDCMLLRGPLIGTDAHVHSSVLASDHYPLSLTVSFC